MSLFTAHVSHVVTMVSKFYNVCPTILVSSAKIYGYMLGICSILSVRSFVKILNSRHDMLHPWPNPLPIFTFYGLASTTRLLNISFTPYITSWLILIFSIFSNSFSWFTISYAFAKSIKKIHVFSSGAFYYSLLILSIAL